MPLIVDNRNPNKPHRGAIKKGTSTSKRQGWRFFQPGGYPFLSFLFSASFFLSGFFSGFWASPSFRCPAFLDFASSASMIFAAFAQGYSPDSFCAKSWVEHSAKKKINNVLFMKFFAK
ncbi:MAG: hypothetical protein ABIW02_03810 [Nitrosospira sp.]